MSRNLFRPTGPDQLWGTDITYIPTQIGMTYLMCIKDIFTKERQRYNYSQTCLARGAIRAVEDAVVKAFDGEVPEGAMPKTDNRNIESFHLSLKMDYVWPYEFQDYGEVLVAIENAFTDYYEKRPHSSVYYLPPRVFRRKFQNDQSFREGYIREQEVKLNEK